MFDFFMIIFLFVIFLMLVDFLAPVLRKDFGYALVKLIGLIVLVVNSVIAFYRYKRCWLLGHGDPEIVKTYRQAPFGIGGGVDILAIVCPSCGRILEEIED